MKKKILKKGTLFWITGLSGAGKTTIAKKIKKIIKKKYGPTLVINGDDLREIFKLKNYNQSKRLEYGKIYCNFLKFIVDQNINVIFTVVGMFDSLRKWNRKNIDNYIEIFIKADIKKIKQKTRKKTYKNPNKNIVGFGISPQFPKKPDILIENNFTKSLDYLSNQIIKKI
jgi:adenylylsulfate kinase-like enzyme